MSSICYSKDGKYLISAGWDGSDSSILNMKVWDAKTNKYIKVCHLKKHPDIL